MNKYIYRRSIQEGLRWLLAGVEACKELGKGKDKANLYNEIWLRYDAQGNCQEALKWYKKSKEILEKIGNSHHLAISLTTSAFYIVIQAKRT